MNTLVRKSLIVVAASLFAATSGARAQDAQERTVAGEVVAVNGSLLTIKPPRARVTLKASGYTAQPLKLDQGTMLEVATDCETHILVTGRPRVPGQPQVTLADVHIGDFAFVLGSFDASKRVFHAIKVTTMPGLASPVDLGVRYIAGEVRSIDSPQSTITVKRPDKLSQTIAFGAATHFLLMDGTLIKLADLKHGDKIYGTGSVKDGVFVPAQLFVSKPQSVGICGIEISPLNPARP